MVLVEDISELLLQLIVLLVHPPLQNFGFEYDFIIMILNSN